ncbi:hypothetical protein METP3_03198 [Methanosarcinales archaeon]|nr:hypothetical protein METP3_03198 [Methanosarcinales archaeon]
MTVLKERILFCNNLQFTQYLLPMKLIKKIAERYI